MNRIEVHYRLPNEFYGLGNGILWAIRIWLFHFWIELSPGVIYYEVVGIRILGLEIFHSKEL